VNSKEIVELTFKKEKTDKIPVHHRHFSSNVASYILGREAFVGGGIQQWREAKSLWEGWHEEYLERSFKDAIEVALITKQDIIRPAYWRYNLKPTKKIDEYTYLYEYGEEKDWKVLRYDPLSEQANIFYYKKREITIEDIKKQVDEIEKEVSIYKPKKEDFSFAIKAQEILGTEYIVDIGGVGIGIPIREANIWFEIMLLDPGIVREYIEQQVEIARKNIEFLSGYGFKYFFGGGDFCSEKGPMYSPKLFEDLILPGIKKVSEICHKFNSYHLFASDGNLWPVSDLLFEKSGIDGYYEIDRKAGMDLEKLRKTYPQLTLLGNISSWTLGRGNKEDVKKEVIECFEIARKYSGIIVGVSNSIVPETPPENIDVLIKTIEDERR